MINILKNLAIENGDITTDADVNDDIVDNIRDGKIIIIIKKYPPL